MQRKKMKYDGNVEINDLTIDDAVNNALARRISNDECSKVVGGSIIPIFIGIHSNQQERQRADGRRNTALCHDLLWNKDLSLTQNL